jgi:hypothetical protein
VALRETFNKEMVGEEVSLSSKSDQMKETVNGCVRVISRSY